MPYTVAERVINVKSTTYGAKGDGVTIDDVAVEKAIQDGVASDRIVYFPAGTYLVSKGFQAKFPNSTTWGADLKIYGDGSNLTTIRLKDNCPGFQSTDTPKSIIVWASNNSAADGSGNEAFSNEARGFTLSIGVGNPKANGLGYVANNQGTIEDVVIKSEDPLKVGGIGLNCTRTGKSGYGSNLIRNLKVVGFDTGIKIVGTEYGQYIENLTLEYQNIVGLDITGHPLTVVGMNSIQKVTAIRAYDQAHLVLINADLKGTAGSTDGSSAIVTYQNNTQVYLSGVKHSAYQRMMNQTQTAQILTTNPVGEFSSIPIKNPVNNTLNMVPSGITLASPASVNLPETDYYYMPLPRDQFHDFWDAWHLAIGSGKPGIAFTSATNWNLYKAASLVIPPHVKHIKGNFANISVPNSTNVFFNDPANKKPLWLVETGTDPLRMDNLHGALYPNNASFKHAGADFFLNTSARQITVNGIIAGGGRFISKPVVPSGTVPGDIYLIDFSGNVHIETATGVTPQRLYARQLNPESGRNSEAKIYLKNSWAFIAGLKTEGTHRIVDAINARIHVIGGLIYPVGFPATDLDMIRLVDTDATFVIAGQGYDTTGQYTKLLSQKFGANPEYVLNKSDVPARVFNAFFLHFNGDRGSVQG